MSRFPGWRGFGPAILLLGLTGALHPVSGAPSTAVDWTQAADTIPTIDELVEQVGPGGDPALAGEGILQIAASRDAPAASNWIHLLTLLSRIDPLSASVAVRAVAFADEGDAGRGATEIEEGLPTLPGADVGPLLALAALLAEESDPTRAAGYRVRVMEEAPNAIEVPEMMLRHGRWLLSIDQRREEGFQMIEELIVAWPTLPLTPEARRLLQVERARDTERGRGASPPERSVGPGVPR
ncbi:MAG: hypothetical protein WD056_01990 [Gemmatimonadota bacterium]